MLKVVGSSPTWGSNFSLKGCCLDLHSFVHSFVQHVHVLYVYMYTCTSSTWNVLPAMHTQSVREEDCIPASKVWSITHTHEESHIYTCTMLPALSIHLTRSIGFAAHTLLILPVHLSQSSVCEEENQYVISEEGGIPFICTCTLYMHMHVLSTVSTCSRAMCNVEKDVPVF